MLNDSSSFRYQEAKGKLMCPICFIPFEWNKTFKISSRLKKIPIIYRKKKFIYW